MLTEIELKAQPEKNYMDDAQLEFFRDRLEKRRAEIAARISSYGKSMKEGIRSADESDSASIEEQRTISLNMLSRDRETLTRVVKALDLIRTGDGYGYDVVTGEPIGINRLLISPETLYSIETMIAQEARMKHHGRAFG